MQAQPGLTQQCSKRAERNPIQAVSRTCLPVVWKFGFKVPVQRIIRTQQGTSGQGEEAFPVPSRENRGLPASTELLISPACRPWLQLV